VTITNKCSAFTLGTFANAGTGTDWTNPGDANNGNLNEPAEVSVSNATASKELTAAITLTNAIADIAVSLNDWFIYLKRADAEEQHAVVVKIVNSDGYDSGNLLTDLEPFVPSDDFTQYPLTSEYASLDPETALTGARLDAKLNPRLVIRATGADGSAGSSVFVYGLEYPEDIGSCGGVLRNRTRRSYPQKRALE
jgi:hypothetical protein